MKLNKVDHLKCYKLQVTILRIIDEHKLYFSKLCESMRPRVSASTVLYICSTLQYLSKSLFISLTVFEIVNHGPLCILLFLLLLIYYTSIVQLLLY